VAIATSGKYGSTATYQLEGYQLWVHQVNQRGGLLGRPVELIVLDDQSEPATSAKLFEQLITVDKVDLVLSPYSSAVTIKELLKQRGMELVLYADYPRKDSEPCASPSS
jgi:branched-chain amino acid transport system substrate-binding protein